MALAADIDTRRVQVAPTEGQAGQVPALGFTCQQAPSLNKTPVRSDLLMCTR